MSIFLEILRNQMKCFASKYLRYKADLNCQKSNPLRNHDFEGLGQFVFDINWSGIRVSESEKIRLYLLGNPTLFGVFSGGGCEGL
jgi:hypothetical protein